MDGSRKEYKEKKKKKYMILSDPIKHKIKNNKTQRQKKNSLKNHCCIIAIIT